MNGPPFEDNKRSFLFFLSYCPRSACCIVQLLYIWAGYALCLRTVRQKEKKRSFVVLERRSIHKSCPRMHNPVLFLWRIVIMQGQWRIQRHVLGDKVLEPSAEPAHAYMSPVPV